jgi:hypothetical protein
MDFIKGYLGSVVLSAGFIAIGLLVIWVLSLSTERSTTVVVPLPTVSRITPVQPILKPTEAYVIVNRGANLRQGPGTNYRIVGEVRAGQTLTVVDRNEAGDWLQLSDGKWISVFLVKGALATLPAMDTPIDQPLQREAKPTSITLPTATPAVGQGADCDPSYPDVCIPSPPPDLDCGQIEYRRFKVVGADPHNFDGDYDGIGCER